LYSYNKHKVKKFFCRFCLHAFSNQELLDAHIQDCFVINGTQKISLPDDEHKNLRFINYHKQLKAPFIIYADFESITKPIQSVEREQNKSYTDGYQLHTPCGFAYKVVSVNEKHTKDCVVYRGENCVEKFINCLKEEEKIIRQIIRNQIDMFMTAADQINYSNSTLCHICENPLNGDKVRDHCHISGKYRGAAHSMCNLKFKYPKNIPVVFHNLKGYDSHLIMQHIGKFDGRISCIPNNMEKYLSFSLGNLVFIDSLQFLNASLDKLVDNTKKNYAYRI
jgi:hypothetical protein